MNFNSPAFTFSNASAAASAWGQIYPELLASLVVNLFRLSRKGRRLACMAHLLPFINSQPLFDRFQTKKVSNIVKTK